MGGFAWLWESFFKVRILILFMSLVTARRVEKPPEQAPTLPRVSPSEMYWMKQRLNVFKLGLAL